jgi:tetratricopeptide (TPR) repeat protein
MGLLDPVEQASSHPLSWSRVKDGLAWVRHRWAFFLLAAFTLFVISTFTPYLVSAFYLELGGRELDRIPSLKSLDHLTTYSPIPLSAYPPRVPPDSGHLAVAIAHLRRAIAWDGNNAQAYYLLGQAYLAQGDYRAAIEALTTYTDLRPDNLLGHMELAQVCEGLALASPPEEVYYDFIEHLSEAAVTTPSVPIQTDYCLPDDPVASCYVASTYWTMPDDKLRPVLFMHPSSWARYVVTVPVEATMLRFSVGMYLPSWDWGGDGALFEVCIQDGAEEKRLFSTHVSNAKEDWGWHEGEVDLTPYAGQVMTLTLGAHPGWQNDSTGDWAGWAEPRLEGVDALQRRVEAEKWWAKAVAEWQAAGLTAQDFIASGKEMWKAKRYEEALGWYERAARVEPGSGDPWYYKGLAYEGLERWEEALGAYERAAELGAFNSVGRSSPYYRMGVMYQWRLEPPRTDAALTAYEAAIKAGDFSANWEAADCHFKRGEILWWHEGDPDEYIAEYQQAIELDPKHVSAYNLLGVAYYIRYGDAAMAEAEIRRALEVAPQNKWAYLYLGDIYHWEGRVDEAAAMYEQALEIDPAFEGARQRLQAIGEDK